MPRITEATEAMRVLKEKLREFNINPEYITVDAVERANGKWVIVFYEEGRILSLKSGTLIGGNRRERAGTPIPA